MSWNGSSQTSPAERKEAGKPTKSYRGILAGGIVVALAGLTMYFVLRDNGEGQTRKPETDNRPKIIESVTPVAPKQAETNVVEEKEDRNSLEWLKKHDKRYFVPPDAVRRPNGRLYTKDGRRILEDLPRRTLYANKGQKKIFDHPAERDIARLLSIEPGKFFIGNGNYGPRFIESFKQSLTQPTLPTKDDDEETKALKKQVNEVKADLKARMDAGEDIGKIMKETEQELRSLAAYRNDMQKQLTALRFDENVSEQDYADYVEAANKMLQDRGMKGLSSPKFAEGQLKYLRERHKALQAAREAKAAQKQ